MADLFVERLTGRAVREGTSVEVQLVMGADQLFGDTPQSPSTSPTPETSDPDGPAWLDGYGPIPAAMAKGMKKNCSTLRYTFKWSAGKVK